MRTLPVEVATRLEAARETVREALGALYPGTVRPIRRSLRHASAVTGKSTLEIALRWCRLIGTSRESKLLVLAAAADVIEGEDARGETP